MPSISQAEMKLHEDGSVTVECGTVEMGQGSVTALAQMAAERLQIPLEQVRMARIDTDHTPFDNGTGSSRSIYTMGLAVTSAADDVTQKCRQIAAGMFEVDVEDVQYADGRFSVVGSPSTAATLAEVHRHHYGIGGGTISGEGMAHTGRTHGEVYKRHPVATPFWTVAAAAAEVAVDRETGQVTVVKYAIAGDAGRVINPIGCSGQLEGAALQSFGHALQEELFWDGGQPVNFSLLDYPVPTFEQLPDLQSILIEQPDEQGPFGAKGFGEVSVTLAGPAIGNAVFDAIGKRVHRLPMHGERVWSTLSDNEG
jgi:CO/xanthine dehydrogenase Mo-binding subunit